MYLRVTQTTAHHDLKNQMSQHVAQAIGAHAQKEITKVRADSQRNGWEMCLSRQQRRAGTQKNEIRSINDHHAGHHSPQSPQS